MQTVLSILNDDPNTEKKNSVLTNGELEFDEKQKRYSYVEVLDYFIKNITKHWDVMELIIELATINNGKDDCDPNDVLEELYKTNPELCRKLEDSGVLLSGEVYSFFLRDELKNRFGYMIHDFCSDINPTDSDEFRFSTYEFELDKYLKKKEAYLQRLKSGDTNGND